MVKDREKSVEPGLATKRLMGVRKMPRIGGNVDRSRNVEAGAEDCKISSYLQNKTEMHYKKMIWELMNKNIEIQLKRKQEQKQKQILEAKNATSKEKDSKVKRDVEIKHQKLSSKINFDMLRKQMDEEQEEGSKEANSKDVLSDHGNQGSIRHDDHKFNFDDSNSENEDFIKEDDQEYDEDDEDLDVSNNYNGNYNFDDEEYEYTYNEDYDY